ncbi:MAG TPA: family 16 glycoside hydrolase, partial [Pirellulales bacterium]
MTAPNTPQCPPEAVLSDFGLGKLDANSADTVSQHLETCSDCRQRVAGLSGDTFLGRLQKAGGKEDGLPRPSSKGALGRSQHGLGRSTHEERRPGRPPHERDGLGSPSSVNAPPELANHADYELVKELGQGGMGTVYLAKNRMMDRPEVLKVISKALLDRPGALERFQQEIRSAAKLQHGNIVGAYSVLRPGELLVFAMEYVKGQDLSEVVKARGPLPVTNAAFYIHQVANGLQHAFEKGMVHRDIKPNNLMLATDGRKHTVKILDFGLAKATSEKSAEGGLTKSGQMLGTPDYVAPEQTLDAHKADIRADIYSLGCTLYFLLSGGPPFEEQSLYAILEAHHKREPKPLNLVRPEVPVELAAVVSKMMAKDPAKRYQTPIEVARALVPFFKPGQSVAPPSEKPAGEEYPPHPVETAPPPRSITPPSFDGQPAPLSLLGLPLPVAMGPVPLQPPPASDDLGVSINVKRPAIRRRSGWSSLPPWQRWAVLGGGAAALLLGIVLLVRTPRGTIEIELSDPDAKVTVAVDGNRVDIAGLDGALSLEAGEHEYTVKGECFETRTTRFQVIRGKNAPLTITLVPKPDSQETAKDVRKTTDGFVSLFDGKDFSGWRIIGNQGWSVRDGAMVAQGSATPGWLMSDRNYANFELDLDYRLVSGAASGIFLRAREGGSTSGKDFYEVQILDDDASAFAQFGADVKNGAIYRQIAPRKHVAAPAGVWNRLGVVLRGDRVQVRINGVEIVDGKLPGGPGGNPDTGRIGLQFSEKGVEFRDVRVRELPAERLAQSDGFTPLLNGKDLAGWGLYERWAQVSVANGEITAVNNRPEADYLFTDRADYTDVHFRCEFFGTKDQEMPAVMVRVDPAPLAGGMRGYLARIRRLEGASPPDKSCATTLLLGKRRGNTYELATGTHSAPRAGEWHKLEILAESGRVQVLLDGAGVIDYHDDGQAFQTGALALRLPPKSTTRLRKIEIRELTPKELKPGSRSRWATWRPEYATPWHDWWRVFQQVDEKHWFETGAHFGGFWRNSYSEVKRTPEFVDIEGRDGAGRVAVRLRADRIETGPDFDRLQASAREGWWTSLGPAWRSALERTHQRPSLEQHWTNAMAPSIAPPEAVDLLRLIDPIRDARQGKWQFINGRLLCRASSYAQIEAAFDPPEEYALTAIAQPMFAGDPFFLGLPVGKSEVLVMLNAGQGAGLSLIDGRAAADNETTRPGPFLLPGQSNVVECKVRKNRVQVTCNGVMAVNWTGDAARLSLPEPWKLPSKRRVFVGGQNAWVHVAQVLISPLRDDDNSMSEEAIKPADGRIDLLKRIDPARDTIYGQWRLGSTGLAIAEMHGRIQVPLAAPDHYRLTAVVSREGRKDQGSMIYFGLPIDKLNTAVVIDNANRADPFIGLSLLDGKRADHNESRRSVAKVVEDVPMTVICTVHPGHVSVQVDGQQALDWRGDARRLAIEWPFPADWRKPFVAAFCGVRFSKLQLEALAPEAPAGSSASGDSSGPEALAADRRAAEYVLSVGGKIKINGQLDGLSKWQGDVREITSASDLPDCPFRLSFIDLNVSRGVTEAGMTALQGTKHLQEIVIDRCAGITDASLANFKDNRQLKSLHLYRTKISGAGLSHFKECSELTWLFLGLWSEFGDADMGFFKDFSGLDSLGMLWLHGTSVGDKGLAHLKGAVNLVQLNLNGTKVSDAGLQVLEKHRKITYLHLHDNSAIGDAGLVWLRECRGLRGVNLKNTKVTAGGVVSLKRALPECKITWDGGEVAPIETNAGAKPPATVTTAKPSRAGETDLPRARYVRIELPRTGTLSLAEVEAYSGGRNLARSGKATQKSTGYGGHA